MTYEEWLEVISSLKSTTINTELLNKLNNTEINTNLSDIINPKLVDMIEERFNLSINKIIKELEYIFSDVNYLDLALLNLKKELNYLKKLINSKHLSHENKGYLNVKLEHDIEEVYKILLKEANRFDYTGIYSMTIKNNMIKWSE